MKSRLNEYLNSKYYNQSQQFILKDELNFCCIFSNSKIVPEYSSDKTECQKNRFYFTKFSASVSEIFDAFSFVSMSSMYLKHGNWKMPLLPLQNHSNLELNCGNNHSSTSPNILETYKDKNFVIYKPTSSYGFKTLKMLNNIYNKL